MKDQKGEGHQVANAYHILWEAKDERRQVIRLILWEAKWNDDWEIQLGRKDGGLQDCEEDSTIIAGEFSGKDHCHRREQRSWWD